ncbi:MAG TPA: outer membrane protein assembly factor, partial [Paludibacter sp.]
MKQTELKLYLRQTPNAAIFGIFRMQLGVYNIAGKDSTKWYNRMWMRMGDKPVIYSPMLTSLSVHQLQKLLENKGYLLSKVESNVSFNGKKAVVNYDVRSNKPYLLRDYSLNLKNIPLTEIASDTSRSLIKTDMLFNTDVLDAERERIT